MDKLAILWTSLMNIPIALVFRNASWRHWQSTFMWVAYNFLGSLMPIWGSFFLLHLFHQHFVMNDFVKHGEFALYTAAFLAPALQQVVRNIKDEKYVLGTGAVLIAVTGLVISAIIYSGLTTGLTLLSLANGKTATDNKSSLDESFLFAATLLLFGLSFLFVVIVTLIENVVFDIPKGGAGATSEKYLQDVFARAEPVIAPHLQERPQSGSELDLLSSATLGDAFKKAQDAGTPNA